jgi:hypothetical protein
MRLRSLIPVESLVFLQLLRSELIFFASLLELRVILTFVFGKMAFISNSLQYAHLTCYCFVYLRFVLPLFFIRINKDSYQLLVSLLFYAGLSLAFTKA